MGQKEGDKSQSLWRVSWDMRRICISEDLAYSTCSSCYSQADTAKGPHATAAAYLVHAARAVAFEVVKCFTAFETSFWIGALQLQCEAVPIL